MATTKSGAKSSPAKRPAPVSTVTAAKVKPATKTKSAAKPKPATKAKAAPKVKAAPATATKTPARGKQAAKVSVDQRRNYIEMAAYYIAERRGFAPGNLLDDWVQAEAEIDRLLAEGRLGG